MGSKYEYGGVALDNRNRLYVVVNGINKLYCINVEDPRPGPDAILFSTNAFGYADFCEVRSITWMDSVSYNPSIVMLLKNGEVWRKDLMNWESEHWFDTAWTMPFPKCRGATGIEYYNEAIYLTFPEFNQVRKMSLSTLQDIAQYRTGVPTDMPYAPGGITVDRVTGRWAILDTVRGDIVYHDLFDFNEGARERYTYGLYNQHFSGDIAWSKVPLPHSPGKDFFVLAYNIQGNYETCCTPEGRLVLYGTAWFKLYEVDDFTGTMTEISGVLLDNVEAGQCAVKHLRLENMTDFVHRALTISIADDPRITADDYLHLSLSPVGPWTRTIEAGDVPGHGYVDFWIRYFPQVGVEAGSFVVQLVLDFDRSSPGFPPGP